MNKKSKKKSLIFKILSSKFTKFCVKWGFIFFIWGVIILAIIFAYYSKDLPNINVKLQKEDVSLELLYSNNELIKEYGNVSNDIVNFAELPLYLVDGLIATEDRKFYKHHGFDYISILRAFFVNLKVGYIKQGGSTITQQLSKMILSNSKKTYKRKIQELLLAIQIERKLTKEEILLMYLNKAYFGAGKYGISEASKFYFGKNISQLNLEESAMLIGLLKAPSKYSPQNDPILARERTSQIIQNMYNTKLLSKENYEEYINNSFDTVINAAVNSEETLSEEMYFADWIKSQLTEYTNKNNIQITTTLNYNVQKAIEKSVNKLLHSHKNDLKNSQIAVIVMGKDGNILGMTGGINYNKTEFNRAIYAYRQAGSAFKLFVFLNGIINQDMNPDMQFFDEPIAVGNWFPENYGNKYYGNVTMKTAFAKSLNSVAVQISEYSGIKNVAKLAKKMGITSKIDENDPTIALGTPLVNLLDMTSSYSVITNDGNAILPYAITKIKDKDNNNIIYSRKTQGLNKILNRKEVNYMKEMMYEVVADGTGKNAFIQGLIDKGECCIGGKTGTSQNYSDAWFIGYANNLTIGIWIGNDDNTSMGRTVGGTLPAILWKNIVLNISDNL